MNFSIQVNQGPYQYQASNTAYQFTKAAIDKGHTIIIVFFYYNGAYNASRFTITAQDENNITNQWAQLKQANGSNINLVVCIASAIRRGIIDKTIANNNNIDGDNIHPAFCISGLGQLIEASVKSDRLIIFGN